MSDVPELEPTTDEVLQLETVPLSAIPVTVEGPIRVQELPRKSAHSQFPLETKGR